MTDASNIKALLERWAELEPDRCDPCTMYTGDVAIKDVYEVNDWPLDPENMCSDDRAILLSAVMEAITARRALAACRYNPILDHWIVKLDNPLNYWKRTEGVDEKAAVAWLTAYVAYLEESQASLAGAGRAEQGEVRNG